MSRKRPVLLGSHEFEGARPATLWLDDGKVIHETFREDTAQGAILVKDARGAEVWLPKTLLSRYDGQWGVPSWLADKKELDI